MSLDPQLAASAAHTVRSRHDRVSTPPAGSPGSPGPSALWAIEDVAYFLGVTKQTIYSWRTTGYGPAGFRVGKHLRWRPATVIAWTVAREEQR